MTEKQRSALRQKCLSNLFCFCKGVMGYDDIIDGLHGRYCSFLSSPSQRKQATMPRSFVKTWIGSIAYPVWITLPRTEENEFPYYKAWEDRYWQLGPDMRILIASYVITNAEKMIGLIRKTYESNRVMQMLFPEVIPHNFNRVKWSNQSACINRNDDFTESTFETAGIGGASVSRHYDLIQEDDLIYAKKDDFSEGELQPDRDDIEKAIGWHKLVTSLLVPGKHTHIHNAGTRWAKKDLVNYIWEKEPTYERFIEGAVDLKELEAKGDWTLCKPTWGECYDIEQLKVIRAAQGPFIFATQYLLTPTSHEEHLFKKPWLQLYRFSEEVPKSVRIFTTVDLAEWSDTKRKTDCTTVVLTCAWDDKHHVWLLHYDSGRYDPSKVIMLMAQHWKIFKPEKIGIEDVYYQKAIGHFAREYMNEGKIPWMSIRGLKPEGNIHKDLRIRAIEPIASNFAVHCKPEHTEFIEEFSDYVPNSKMCKKDILDTLAYQIQIARPGVVVPDTKKAKVQNIKYETKMDDFLKWAHDKTKGRDMFGNPGVVVDPYNEEQLDTVASTNEWDQFIS